MASEACSFCSRIECSIGQYCPANFAVSIPCPPTYYCPTLTSQIICPAGYNCREGSSAPTKCNQLSSCPEGTSSPLNFMIVVILIVVLSVWFGIIKYIVFMRTWRRKWTVKERERFESLNDKAKEKGNDKDKEDELGGLAMLRKTRNLNLSFSNLSVTLNDGKASKKIIDNVSGDIRAGRLTAIMGPSGAGKSSFLHVIGGRLRAVGQGQKSVHISGSVLINGERRPMHSYRRVIGFVPQDDILHEGLTPKSSLLSISNLRLPSSFTKAQRKELVNNVITLLDLEKIRHDRIGSPKTRGVSGGQRKRVNIGSELVADPWMLFLDEPTSGLDSAGAAKVVTILRKLANLGLTVVCVLHQPRLSIFEMLDDIILLGHGGKLAYSGTGTNAVNYFKKLGFKMPKSVINPADWLTDVVAGEIANSTTTSITGRPDLKSTELQVLWNETRTARLDRVSEHEANRGENMFQNVDAIEAKLLTEGLEVMKHPRFGRPELRKLFLKIDDKDGSCSIVWSSMKSLQGGHIFSDRFGFAGAISAPMRDVREIRDGLTTSIFERTGVPEKSNLYLSVIFEARTLDIECMSEDERDDIFICLEYHMRKDQPLKIDPGMKAPSYANTPSYHQGRRYSMQLNSLVEGESDGDDDSLAGGIGEIRKSGVKMPKRFSMPQPVVTYEEGVEKVVEKAKIPKPVSPLRSMFFPKSKAATPPPIPNAKPKRLSKAVSGSNDDADHSNFPFSPTAVPSKINQIPSFAPPPPPTSEESANSPQISSPFIKFNKQDEEKGASEDMAPASGLAAAIEEQRNEEIRKSVNRGSGLSEKELNDLVDIFESDEDDDEVSYRPRSLSKFASASASGRKQKQAAASGKKSPLIAPIELPTSPKLRKKSSFGLFGRSQSSQSSSSESASASPVKIKGKGKSKIDTSSSGVFSSHSSSDEPMSPLGPVTPNLKFNNSNENVTTSGRNENITASGRSRENLTGSNQNENITASGRNGNFFTASYRKENITSSGRNESVSNSSRFRRGSSFGIAIDAVLLTSKIVSSTIQDQIPAHIRERWRKKRRLRKEQKKSELLDPQSRSMPSVFVQTKHYLYRSFLVQETRAMAVDLSLITLCGLLLGIIYGDVEANGNELYTFAMATMAMGIMSSTAVERYFPNETLVFLRETGSGCSSSAYFIGKNVAHLPFIFIAPICFLTFYMTFAVPRVPPELLYFNFLLVTWTCTGAGYFLSLTFNNKAQIACVFYPLLSTMMSGVNPTLPELRGDPEYTDGNTLGFGVGFYIAQFSYSRWSVNMFWSHHLQQFNSIVFPNLQVEEANHAYDENSVVVCAVCLFMIGVFFRIAAFMMVRGLKTGSGSSFVFTL